MTRKNTDTICNVLYIHNKFIQFYTIKEKKHNQYTEST